MKTSNSSSSESCRALSASASRRSQWEDVRGGSSCRESRKRVSLQFALNYGFCFHSTPSATVYVLDDSVRVPVEGEVDSIELGREQRIDARNSQLRQSSTQSSQRRRRRRRIAMRKASCIDWINRNKTRNNGVGFLRSTGNAIQKTGVD